MLLVTRYRGEKIIIGDNVIKITCLGVNWRGQVKIGIEAPESISIMRSELVPKEQAKKIKIKYKKRKKFYGNKIDQELTHPC